MAKLVCGTFNRRVSRFTEGRYEKQRVYSPGVNRFAEEVDGRENRLNPELKARKTRVSVSTESSGELLLRSLQENGDDL